MLMVLSPHSLRLAYRISFGGRYFTHPAARLRSAPRNCNFRAMASSSNNTVSAPPETLFKPIFVPNKVLMGPGPSSAPPRVLAAGSLPLLGHLHGEFVTIMDEIKAGIKYLFQTENEVTLAVSGSGHTAMEMACDTVIERGEKVLVATSGIWGERFSDMVERHGAEAIKIEKKGKAFTNEEIKQALIEHKPTVMFITHGESSSTLLQPIENLGHLCHEHGCLLIVDSVAAAGGVPVFMDKWGIDVMYTGSQKCLSAPPGVSPISFSERAVKKYTNRTHKVVSFCTDLDHLSNYWQCDKGPVRRYHHTAPVTCMYQLREALALLAEEGLEASWARHGACAKRLRDGIKALGLEIYIDEPEHQLPTIVGVVVPEGVDWKAMSQFLMKDYRIEVSGGLGHSAGVIWRVGIMGYNARPDVVDMFLRAFKAGLDKQGYPDASKL